jgi:hypothetical protein
MKNQASVVPLNEAANIYIVVDESGKTIGTGTRDVCEVLARLTIESEMQAQSRVVIPTRPHDNVHSAIKI